MGAAVEIRSLKKVYRVGRREQVALRGLDVEVNEGEVFGLVGPNGAGKSTAIKILLGLVWPSAGEAMVFGAPAGSREAREKIGYLPEVANYHEYMSARELIEVHATLAGVPASERQARCDEVLASVGLTDRKTSRIREFSKGMKQRFGIAQALVGDPPLLVLDELTSGLDPVAQIELKGILTRLRERGKTILFSSHTMTEVETVCDRVGVVHRGKLEVCGTLDDVLEGEELVSLRFAGSPELVASLREKSWECTSVAGGTWSMKVPKDQTHELVELIGKGGGELVELVQRRKSLEQKFYEIATS